MDKYQRLKDREEALEKKKALAQRLRSFKPKIREVEPQASIAPVAVVPISEPERVPVASMYGKAQISLYRDDDAAPISPASALQNLVDIYLHAAHHKTRHIALVWPACPRTLILVHALATLERWAQGDKQGVRGLVYPVKTNAFYPLNHIHLDREALLEWARHLIESPGVPKPDHITRGMPDKDAYLFSLASIRPDAQETFNPSIAELLPHFYAHLDFERWPSCSHTLLAQTKAKLARRSQKHALKLQQDVIGDPRTAPDAIFALDGRLDKEKMRKPLEALKSVGIPDVVLVNATRAIRLSSRNWRGTLSRFCLLLEEVFGERAPGVLVVTDEPHAAYILKDELWKQNDKRTPEFKWKTKSEYAIHGAPCAVGKDGLLNAGVMETQVPAPRVFDVSVVDAEATRLANRLHRITTQASSGRDSAQPVIDAARYIERMAALPCGIKHLVDWLSSADVEDHTKSRFSWITYAAGLVAFEKTDACRDHRKAVLECLNRGNELFERYQNATPFAHKLAELVCQVAGNKRRNIAVVFTSALYRRLAEAFLSTYGQFPSGSSYDNFKDRVHFISSTQLDSSLEKLDEPIFVFAGLDEEGLRVVLTDDRIPSHSAILLTQGGALYLRASLRPIVERLEEFKPYKPRIESILAQLKGLPEGISILASGDFVLPTFRVELSSDVRSADGAPDPDAWRVLLEGDTALYRRPSHQVYVYDPVSADSSDRGFRGCEVSSLQPGDKLFVMSPELRELVEQVLRDAGVPIQNDKTFEAALREYHAQVLNALSARYPSGSMSEKVRKLRADILQVNPHLEKDFPGMSAVLQWVNLGKSTDTPFELLRPQAPLKEAHFKAFAEALGMVPLQAAYQWQRVIMAIRNTRRQDGRHVSDTYTYMLLRPESAMVQANIKRQTLEMLFDRARESVITVEAVIQADGSAS